MFFIAKCSLNKCKNGGTCETKNGNAVCTCPDNYTGEYCQIGKLNYKYICIMDLNVNYKLLL